LNVYIKSEDLKGVTLNELGEAVVFGNAVIEKQQPFVAQTFNMKCSSPKNTKGYVRFENSDGEVFKNEFEVNNVQNVMIDTSQYGQISKTEIKCDNLVILNCNFELLNDLSVNQSFENGIRKDKSEGISFNNGKTIIKSQNETQQMFGSVMVRDLDAYDINLKYACNGISEDNAFRINMMLLDSYGNCVSPWKELVCTGGTSKMQEYTYALTGRDQSTAFAIFSVELLPNVKGSATLESIGIEKIEEKVTFNDKWAPYFLIDDSTNNIDITIETTSSLPRNYKIGYTLTYLEDGFVKNGELKSVTTNINKPITVNYSLGDLRYGGAMLEINVFDTKRKAATYYEEVCLYKPYKETYFDDYSTGKIGMSSKHILPTNGQVMEVFKKIGGSCTRWDPAWAWAEFAKGIYDFEEYETVHEMRGQYGAKVAPVIICYNNPIYDNTNSDKGAVDTPEEVQGLADFATNFAKNFPDITDYEIWNEPNAPGYWTGASVYEYTNVVKTVSSFMREEFPDTKIYGGCIDVSKDGLRYSRDMFDMNVYPFIDSFSVHPYYHPALNDEAFPQRTRSYMEIMEEHGGWKDVDLSEVGWRTSFDEKLSPTQAE
ncbi:MAG: hypothetical protein RR957_06150, partial [Oscillospiraceae bacterium]